MTNDLMSPALRRRRKPETLRLRAVMPSLSVRDLERSIAWYRDVLGFVIADLAEADGRPIAAQMIAGKVRFLLMQDDAPDPSVRKGEGFRIFCATRQNIDNFAALIEERGGNISEGPRNQWGGRDFTVVDPDGFHIVITTGTR